MFCASKIVKTKTWNRGQTGLAPFEISWKDINANQVFLDSQSRK